MLQDYTPKTITCFKEGFTAEQLFQELFAGITVGIIALPLAMAFAIGAGVGPERGLFTAIVAGFLISLLGGSRVQIGGPTGAFVVIIFDIIQRHGYAGLAIATLMAGVMLILMGVLRFGVLLKFIPYPVTTGFTTGIAINIFSSQIKDLFGLNLSLVPARFLERWAAYWEHASTWNLSSFLISSSTLGLIIFFRWIYPKLPGAILAVIAATLAVLWLDLPVATIQNQFGEIPRMLPSPSFPALSFEMMVKMLPDAFTVALLGGIESLLSAHVADGMTGDRHRSNCELVAQGFANIGSILFGGIPATGAIARTTANINLHAKTPLAGMVHAVTILLLMVLFAPWASLVPMPALAAVLTLVAWNMSERNHFIEILKGPWSDIVVLLITFILTVLIDLTVAVQVGVLLAALLFAKRMTDSTTIRVCKILAEDEAKREQDPEIILRRDVPRDVAVFEINGPFFFGISNLLNEELRLLPETPRIFILRMSKVPVVDASGIHALKEFCKKCRQRSILFLVSGLQKEVKQALNKSGVVDEIGMENLFPHLDDALKFARKSSSETLPVISRAAPEQV